MNIIAYFIVNEPSLGRQWTNGGANLVSWTKGVLDGIAGFDVEMARMGTDGLQLIARNGRPKFPFLSAKVA